MAFSISFIEGLETKSNHFQAEFYGIMEEIYKYFDTQEEINDFQKYYESQISYKNPGNQLYYVSGSCGGSPSQARKQEYIEQLQEEILGLFQDDRDFKITGALGLV